MSRTPLPRLVMTLLVRDEADIVAQNVAWHLSQGVSHVIVTDNASTDGTADALAPFVRQGVLTLLHEPSAEYLQDVWTTRMALMARDEIGADWVICNDADEFWRAPTGDLRDMLPEDGPRAMLVCRRHNMIAAREDLNRAPWPDTLVCRAVDPPPPPRPPLTEDGLLDTPLDRPFFQYRLPTKVILPTRGLKGVARGAHDATFEGPAPQRRDCPVEIFHYPVRARPKFERSVQRIGAAVGRTAGLSLSTSWKYRRWSKMTRAAGTIDAAFREALPDRSRLERDLASGRVVEDRSMARALRRLSRGSAPVPHPPSIPRAGDMGALVMVVGPDAARNAAMADLLVGFGGTPPREGSARTLGPVLAAIATEAGRCDDDPRSIPPGWFDRPAASAHRAALLEALLTDFADLDRAVLHDTRLCLMLPLWRDIAQVQDLGLEIVLAVGAPPSGARPAASGAFVWAARVLAAERASRGLSRSVVLPDATGAETRRMARAALSSGEADVSRAPPPRRGDAASARLPDLVADTLEAARILARGGETAEIHARFDRLSASLDAGARIFGQSLVSAGAEIDRLGRARDRATRRAAQSETAHEAARTRIARLETLLRCRKMLLEGNRRGGAKRVFGRDRRHLATIRAAAEFDPDWYRATYPDVAARGMDPAAHFLRHGAREGRNPGPEFDTLRYYDANPDVLEAGQIAFLHYLRHGRNEGRTAFPALPLPV